MELPPEKAGTIIIEYDDTSKNQSSNSSINYTNYGWRGPHLANSWNGTIEGASTIVKTDGTKQYAECFIPNSYFSGSDFTLKCGGSTINSANIKNIDGSSEESTEPTTKSTEPTTEPTEPTTEPTQAAYEGIVIDGKFDDWEAVPKCDVNENKGWDTVDQMAMVWDGDWIYLYFMAAGTDQGWAVTGNWDSVCGGGPKNNGQYAITTDLDRTITIQLANSNGVPTVAGVSGAKVAVNNKSWDKAPHMWEVAIPADVLVDKDTGKDKYKDSISFGFYQVEPIITGVSNLQDGDNEDKTFNGIKYDGEYEDWSYYPHSVIQHATSGTQENVVDAEAALYAEGDTLYGHVVTNMPAHLQEAGQEFTEGITIKINDDEKLEFAPRFIAVDENGNINWNPQRQGLSNGTYEFYIVSLDAPGTSKNINDLKPGDTIYGRMLVTIQEGRNECEWEMDIEKLASHLRPNVSGTEITKIDPSDIKTISAQYIRIGNEWVTTAGTSTGPIVGIILCLGVVGGVLLYRKKRLGKKAA